MTLKEALAEAERIGNRCLAQPGMEYGDELDTDEAEKIIWSYEATDWKVVPQHGYLHNTLRCARSRSRLRRESWPGNRFIVKDVFLLVSLTQSDILANDWFDMDAKKRNEE